MATCPFNRRLVQPLTPYSTLSSMQKPVLFILFGMFLVTVPLALRAQIGGQDSFDFVNLPQNARLIALGGANVSAAHGDVNQFVVNPGLLTDSVAGQLSLNYYSYYADVANISAAYAHRFQDGGMLGIAVQSVQYGSFEGFDPTGQATGEFTAADLAVGLTYARKLGPFSLGGSVKFAQQQIDTYSAIGLLFDFGAAFIHPKADFTVGLAVRNLGLPLKMMTPAQEFQSPLDVQLGATYKPGQMPFRLSLTLQRLHQLMETAYEDPALAGQTDAFGNPLSEEVSTAEQALRHVVLGLEFVPSQLIQVRMGYNFLHRAALAPAEAPGLTGLSFGAELHLGWGALGYARSQLHTASGAHNFTLRLDMPHFFPKKRTIEGSLPPN